MKVIIYDLFYEYYKFYSRLFFCITYHYNFFVIVGSANIIFVFSEDTIKPTFWAISCSDSFYRLLSWGLSARVAKSSANPRQFKLMLSFST